jgi:sRNA-binding protein
MTKEINVEDYPDIAALAERFPKTFTPNAPRPLKRGIHLDLRIALPD